jgi:hypothetical protein
MFTEIIPVLPLEAMVHCSVIQCSQGLQSTTSDSKNWLCMCACVCIGMCTLWVYLFVGSSFKIKQNPDVSELENFKNVYYLGKYCRENAKITLGFECVSYF